MGELKRNRSTTAELSDELILEIIARLPLKYAIQCSVLNKYFRRCISHPIFLRRIALSSSITSSTIFHCSGYNPKIFTRSSREKSPADFRVSITLDRETSILASCNGVLLLRFNSSYTYYVFNPITSGVMLVDYHLDRHDAVGLAVDIAAENFHFKLVALDTNPGLLRFSVVVPSDRGFGASTLLKSRVDFDCETFVLMTDNNIRPVYAHGCLYWLEESGRRMAVFDVENEQARIINGPACGKNGHKSHAGVEKWFGLVDGSTRFIYALREEIVIYSHDHRRDEWQVKHTIANICNESNNDYRNGVPLFFDGRHLFLHLRKRGEEGEVHVHDFLTEEWKKSGNVAAWTDWNQHFYSFFPTTAKVSDEYLHKSNTFLWENRAFRNSFLRLRQLLRHI